jgi:predicted Zn-dependent protease
MTRWAHFPITVFFVKDSEYTRAREQAACAGFDCWGQATHGLISYRLTSNRSTADLTVRFDATKSDGLTYTESMDGLNRRGNMSLGVAMPNHDDGEIPMDDLSCVAAHEFGHALGINGHSKSPLDLMYREHSIGEPWSITDRDLNTLKTDYSGLFSEGSSANR